MDYSLLRRREYSRSQLDQLPEWDFFISAFNQSERVQILFTQVRAYRKEWLIHPEYDFSHAELPKTGGVQIFRDRDEADFWNEFFVNTDFQSMPLNSRICVDITGFMRPHLMLLLLLLRKQGFACLDVIYSDPVAYQSGEKTTFSKGSVDTVRQVRGFEGSHRFEPDNKDILVIGAGYDDQLITRVAEDKRSAQKLAMFGLPSLQPHMYEENRLRASISEESVGPLTHRTMLFAPANDPFATAQELHDRLSIEYKIGFSNLYLSPLATKVQALGFALYYLCECVNQPTSIIFPYSKFYARETSHGLSRVSVFHIELDWFNL